MPSKEKPLKLSKITKRSQPLRTRGPASINKGVSHTIGPGEPPPGFLNPWNSWPEWVLYWALFKVLHEIGDVRKGPWIGGEHFGYQTVLQGGRSSLGGQIVDFVVYMPGQDIGIFLQGDRFHIGAGSIQHAIDYAKMLAASRYMTVKPIFENDIISDPTGEQACRTVVETLGGRKAINPITSGVHVPKRMGRLYGGSDQ